MSGRDYWAVREYERRPYKTVNEALGKRKDDGDKWVFIACVAMVAVMAVTGLLKWPV